MVLCICVCVCLLPQVDEGCIPSIQEFLGAVADLEQVRVVWPPTSAHASAPWFYQCFIPQRDTLQAYLVLCITMQCP